MQKFMQAIQNETLLVRQAELEKRMREHSHITDNSVKNDSEELHWIRNILRFRNS